ncbi:hypothetical protein BDY19DRAFT_996814 [Irpex rosettiformis]|uniref:Uncharacterized protein n=1 Tax=Irpex rosettiformis TaxID=378272 RepID=A0ACB8TU28_9APHY|nr:hypothetical protein BDY19DRAFT_996814 [Irpex rosettiformis]
MSNSTQDSGNDYSEIQNFVIQTRAIVASAAFYCFEWLITMDQEAEHIWARKWSLSTLIFAGSRYATLLLLISELTPAPSRAVPWNKAVGTVRQASRLHIKVPLGRVLIEDGTFLFLGLVIINVFQLLADNISDPTYLAVFKLTIAMTSRIATSMQSIVMCRFMLNLKQAGSGPSPTPDNTTFHKSTIRFNANILIGNLGESMSLWDDEDTLEQTDQDENSEKTTITAVEPVDDTRLVAERESERAVKDLRAPIMDPIIISSVVDGVEVGSFISIFSVIYRIDGTARC